VNAGSQSANGMTVLNIGIHTPDVATPGPMSSCGSPSLVDYKNHKVGLSVNLKESVKVRDVKFCFRFTNVKVKVAVPKWMPAFSTPGVPGQTKHILRGISGTVHSGQVLAIIGASGSGKTTLLDQLSLMPMMPGGKMTGRVEVNGCPVSQAFFKSKCAYVNQDDRLWGALTVFENLEIASKLYEPKLSSIKRRGKIEEVLRATGLLSCQQTKVGNALIKGISGGQRRRVSIAVELMGSPAILFLDEPTSGLDSKSAAEIMQLLGLLAKDLNVLIICSIHQPSSRTFFAFDLILLLSKGRACYFGPANDSVGYFAKRGFQAPPNMNPADFLIEISNPDFTEKSQVDRLILEWETFYSEELKNSDEKKLGEAYEETEEPEMYASGLAWQVWVLVHRMALSYMRDPGAYIGRAVLYVTMSIIFGVIYVGAEREQEHVLDYLFAIAWGMATPSYMAVSAG